MSGAGLSWSALLPSRERRMWLGLGAGASAILALCFLGKALAEPALALGLAALLCGAAAGAAALASRRPPLAVAVAIDAEGRVWMRAEPDGEPGRAWPRLVADRLVTLDTAAGLQAVWHDSLAPAQFRRLCAHARWHVERGDPQRALPAGAASRGN